MRARLASSSEVGPALILTPMCWPSDGVPLAFITVRDMPMTELAFYRRRQTRVQDRGHIVIESEPIRTDLLVPLALPSPYDGRVYNIYELQGGELTLDRKFQRSALPMAGTPRGWTDNHVAAEIRIQAYRPHASPSASRLISLPPPNEMPEGMQQRTGTKPFLCKYSQNGECFTHHCVDLAMIAEGGHAQPSTTGSPSPLICQDWSRTRRGREKTSRGAKKASAATRRGSRTCRSRTARTRSAMRTTPSESFFACWTWQPKRCKSCWRWRRRPHSRTSRGEASPSRLLKLR